ncbi:ribonuclease P protein component [Undibacterium danionis]|uniref:Ribonuclease P protein component n=1 Tax=Undibacterium danionis TaxID=1812100 RepID=A0ABV6IFF5_9BURK
MHYLPIIEFLEYRATSRIHRQLVDSIGLKIIVTNLAAIPDLAQNQLSGGDFARERRILKADEFSSAFRLRPVQKTAHFVLYARSNALPHARLGVVAAKRFAPRAATRNMIKRVTREIFRQSDLMNVDCIVRLSKPVNSKAGPATNAQLKRALRDEVLRLFVSQRATTRIPVAPVISVPESSS